MITLRGWALALLLVATGGLQADDGWVGKEVIPKRGTPEISRTDENGQVIVLGKFDVFPAPVRAEKGEWVKIQVHDIGGWIAKDKVVRMNEGIEYFTGRINTGDDLAEAYAKRAWLWSEKNEPDIAIKDATEAIRLKPTAFTYCTRGTSWYAKKEYDKAIQDYSEAIRLDPKHDSAFYDRGLAWSDKKENDKAIEDYSEAIRLDPKYVKAYYSRGNAWLNKKEYDKAIADYSETIRLDPKFVNAYYNRARAWDNKKEYDKVTQDYLEAIRLDSKYAIALNNLAWLRATCPEEKQRDGKKSRRVCTEGMRIDSMEKTGLH